MTGLRQIAAIPIPNLVPAEIGEVGPTFEWADPNDLWVEESYQRNLSDRSITLIRKIIAGWSWAGIKPPICARDEEGRLVVVDGQHTAIAAASHGSIPSIPIMIVPAGDARGRAKAFIGHNTDRLALTQTQMFWAAVEAGDEIAVAVAEGCGRSGAKLCKIQPANGMWKTGDTIAVGALKQIAVRKGKAGVSHVLRVLIDANRGPVRADEIKAVAWLLFDIGEDHPTDFEIATLVKSKSPDAWLAMAARLRETEPMSCWKALATIWRAQLRKLAKPPEEAPKRASLLSGIDADRQQVSRDQLPR